MIDENPPIQPKRLSPRGASRPIQIQERDLAILYSLSVGRYLTAPAIEWLHYPTWRERYKAYLERQKTDESLFYRPLNHVYRRLIALRAGEVPLVYRLSWTAGATLHSTPGPLPWRAQSPAPDRPPAAC